MNQETVFLLVETDDYDEVGTVVGVFTGPEAEVRAHEVKRLKDMIREGTSTEDVRIVVKKMRSNPSNIQLGLGPANQDIMTDPFVHSAIAQLFTSGSTIVPAWLNTEWLAAEVKAMTNENIRIDGQILRLADGPTSSLVQSATDAGFIESEQY